MMKREAVVIVRANGMITIPKALREKANLKDGDILRWEVVDGKVHLIPLLAVPKSDLMVRGQE